ncbi:NAD(P)-dependent dehydrogenase (short-subunit alcohol dehydrogenase family) [Pullulanibacillus pueri]|uniref:3-hydroxybutyrate dehydrogenase n=1 Tax=Pullulanibacillus pueri TaxID=1437324 RepID=A0A8J2ZVM3_9BACL|nr:SDR family oxidoreductase [Pullulanibacillus pueri]MBM7680912.1 NAD(P)-dependent dehydrogenase (short-subunit alcohol dehydrogenase family) [Pullulanibacillus pueri]GGH81306.1 3-hydroxybutyrate dehydrogenase [Pullulanibacillus pueri]
MTLKDQVAIITGGAGGIGAASAELFAAEGAKVVVTDINELAIAEVVQNIHSQGHKAIGITCDVTDKHQVMALVDQTIETFGHLDILFNNAGTILPKAIETIEETEWDRLFQINVKSMFLTIKHALPHLKATKGRIINMASMTGVMGQQHNPAYSATKGAVIALTKALAIDMAPEGVRVNALCPAGVNTPLMERWLSEQRNPEQARLEQDRSHLLGYTASTMEIARVALFLASEASSFVTGEAMTVDGGATLGYGSGAKAEWQFVDQG